MRGMKMADFGKGEYLVISCKQRIPYGRVVTILESAVKHKDSWATSIYAWPSIWERASLSRAEPAGRNFLVFSATKSEKGGFAHYALPTTLVEAKSNQIEAEIVSNLHR